MNKEKKILITVDNHFDIGWRRSQDRQISSKGYVYISYSDIQRYNIDDNIALCEKYPQYRFNIENVWVVRNYLENYPEKAERLKELYREGRCYTPLSGENIMDSNMPCGESIVMNFVRGKKWIESELGYSPHLAIRNDSFGNSAQIPQILKKCGIKWVTGLNYSSPSADYWKGIDGSVVYCGNIPEVGRGGGWKKYSPCSKCNGFGNINGLECDACKGRGIDRHIEKEMHISFDSNAFGDSEVGRIVVNSEEIIPNEEILRFVDKYSDSFNIRVAKLEDPYTVLYKKIINLPEESTFYHNSAELNPNNTGCYVSRIKTKQWVRKIENSLGTLETLLVLSDTPEPILMETLRRNALYCMCHDQITGEHVDAVFEDITEKVNLFKDGENEVISLFEGKGDGITVFNSLSVDYNCLTEIKHKPGFFYKLISENGKEYLPVETSVNIDKYLIDIPALKSVRFNVECINDITKNDISITEKNNSYKYSGILQGNSNVTQTINGGDINTIENDYFRLAYNIKGILSIYDKQQNIIISEKRNHYVGQLVYEHDEGSPWATLSPDRHEENIDCSLESVEKCGGFERIVYSYQSEVASTGSIEGLSAKHIITLYKGIKKIDFKTEVKWDDYNRRLKVVFPIIGNAENRYLYEIPYAFIRRDSYEPVYNWAGSNGDWPAINWVGMNIDNRSIALFNRGLPCNRMDNYDDGELITISLLRCPALPTYLHEPKSYSMTEWDGMRDAGEHCLEYALTSYNCLLEDSTVVADGTIYNRNPCVLKGNIDLFDAPKIKSDNIRISALKASLDGTGMIIRAVEFRGKNGIADITVPSRFQKVYNCTLDETEIEELPIKNGCVSFKSGKFEIQTIKMV